MSETCQVLAVLSLQHRVLQWDRLDRLEFDFFQDLLCEHGLLAISGNEQMCAVEEAFHDASGAVKRIDFWLKIRGQWMFLSLELRFPGVFVLHDTKREWNP